MNKTIGIIVGVVILAIALYYLANQNQANAPTNETSQSQQDQTQQPAGQNNQATSSSQSQSSGAANVNVGGSVNVGNNQAGGNVSTGEDEPMAPDIQVKEIVYDGSKYAPSALTIKVNDYIIFKNNSNTDFWPASAPHPSHANYPEFDAKKAIAAGGKFQFQFTKEGEWGFHDHLNPSTFGKITVTK